MSGCFNRPPLHNPDWPGRAPIPFRMSPVCEYTKSDLGQADKNCTGCKHKHVISAGSTASDAITLVVPVVTYWRPMSECPQGKPVLLLGEGGVPTTGRYIRGEGFWHGWADFPVKRVEVEA